MFMGLYKKPCGGGTAFFFARIEPHKGNLPRHSDKSYFNKIFIIYFRVVLNAKMCFYFG